MDATLGAMETCGGILIYSPEGYMSVWLSRKEQTPFMKNAIDGGSDEEKLKAYNSFHGYSGRYEVNEASGTVTHYPIYGAFPNQLGKALVKKVIIEGNLVKLDDPNMNFDGHNGKKKSSYVQWKKINR